MCWGGEKRDGFLLYNVLSESQGMRLKYLDQHNIISETFQYAQIGEVALGSECA